MNIRQKGGTHGAHGNTGRESAVSTEHTRPRLGRRLHVSPEDEGGLGQADSRSRVTSRAHTQTHVPMHTENPFRDRAAGPRSRCEKCPRRSQVWRIYLRTRLARAASQPKLTPTSTSATLLTWSRNNDPVINGNYRTELHVKSQGVPSLQRIAAA